ncbi:hypothetical protein B0H63DRAFT_456259 [Podospora didyma]|uniref:Rhodopsin domain-containing protein n=1 Tax=Podospora didyma TaxID=330526 RepID=A0AAE0N0W6_9PEZI|nr:hypothetical protein B0H63DRAFT_456259 [Podospora didyma]
MLFCLGRDTQVYIARIRTRYHKGVFGAADYTITVAMVAKALSASFTTVAIQHGFGKHTPTIPDGTAGLVTISNYLLGARRTGVIASGFARISIASLILPILRPGWRRRLV